MPGIVADGSFIASANSRYSTDGGASWSLYAGAGTYTSTSLPPGVNGTIAYSTTGKRAATIGVEYDAKGNFFTSYIRSVNSTGSAANATGANLGGGTNTGNIISAPAFNQFFIANQGGSASTWSSADGTTGATVISAISVGSPASTRPGVSDDGYPIVGAYLGGPSTNVQCRKYTSSDMSTYSVYGTLVDLYMSYPYGNNSPWVWCPINGRYYLVGVFVSGSGNQVFVRRSPVSTTDPQNMSSSATFTVSYPGLTVDNVNVAHIMEDEFGTLWVSGWFTYTSGKTTDTTPYTYYSTDAGSTWTVKSGNQVLAISKNFT